MPDRSGATLFEDLPAEMIDKILTQLPSKDLGRCRAVSTSLHSATSTSEFMLEHHRCQPSRPIIDGRPRPSGLVVFRDAGAPQQLWTFVWDPEISSKELLHGACDGFLIVSRGLRFYICNPAISKHAPLPLPQVGPENYNSVIGFYRHDPTGEYRVLWVSHSQPGSQSKPSLYIITVGSNKPRQVRVRMPAVLPPSAEQKLLNDLRSWSYYAPSVHHCGGLHWCPYGASDIWACGADIIVFDTQAETFRCIRSPAQSCPNRKLFHMEGTLALWGASSTRSFTIMDVWVMQDYKAQIWAFKYRIDLSMVEASRRLYLTTLKKKKIRQTPLDSTVEEFNDMTVLNERELLIKFNKKHVLHWDIDGKFLEIIVPILCHEIQEEDEGVFLLDMWVLGILVINELNYVLSWSKWVLGILVINELNYVLSWSKGEHQDCHFAFEVQNSGPASGLLLGVVKLGACPAGYIYKDSGGEVLCETILTATQADLGNVDKLNPDHMWREWARKPFQTPHKDYQRVKDALTNMVLKGYTQIVPEEADRYPSSPLIFHVGDRLHGRGGCTIEYRNIAVFLDLSENHCYDGSDIASFCLRCNFGSTPIE
ncbi:unnamed protein product [Triticum turgidum subsp. durum]|uniref:F-box domain-containing protein n=1 Tax=Triticum turgidum subsp. durum TaxID=4567 RepID=A0A9R0RB57_TRITD|nr:unnamed protein product [Triticum turgidum subsp. durum]